MEIILSKFITKWLQRKTKISNDINYINLIIIKMYLNISKHF